MLMATLTLCAFSLVILTAMNQARSYVSKINLRSRVPPPQSTYTPRQKMTAGVLLEKSTLLFALKLIHWENIAYFVPL